MSIQVKNISKKYGDLSVIDNISFDLKQGDIIGFLGVNGAGKSTTMKILAGIITPDNGTVDIFSHNMASDPNGAKRRLGYLSEDNALYENMYVREYLEYSAGIFRLKNIKQEVDKVIDMVDLKNESHKLIRTLSKGNKQRVGLAQAIIHNPDFLILDEPMSGLDPHQQTEIKELIVNLSKSRIILFSTHILQEVSHVATRIMILHKGKIAVDEAKSNINSIETLFYDITK